MRYGILGDIHGNLSALERVLECLEDEGIDTLISVGDVVGYGAAPGECIALLQDRKAFVVKGNHDAACIGELDVRPMPGPPWNGRNRCCPRKRSAGSRHCPSP